MTPETIELTTKLTEMLPQELQSYALVVAVLVAGLRRGDISEANIQAQISKDSKLASSFQCLSGQDVSLSDTVLSFEGGNTGDVHVQSVAGRDVVSISGSVIRFSPPHHGHAWRGRGRR